MDEGMTVVDKSTSADGWMDGCTNGFRQFME